MYVFLIGIILLTTCWCGQTQRKGKIEEFGKDGFVVTWASPDHPNPYAFNSWPRTETETKGTNWTLLDDGCEDHDLKYAGRRYIWNDDVSAFPIYDVAGKVAGIQAVIRKDVADKNGAVDYSKHPTTHLETIRGVEVYRFTAYFEKPSKICKRGRSDFQFKMDGTISNLYIQKGPNPVKNSVWIPKTQDEFALQSQRWVEAKCVPTMGLHYFYNISVDQECGQLYPYFLMYGVNHKMTGFGFFLTGIYKNIRFEYVPKIALPMFVDPYPKCLNEMYDGGSAISSFHIFVEPNPKAITC